MNRTRALATIQGLPIRALEVEVLGGVAEDRGTKARAEESLTIGTASNNHLVLTDQTVSRYHIELSRSGPWILLVDHGSTNGTTVSAGAVRLQRAELAAGTVVRLGRSEVRIGDGGTSTLDLHEGTALAGVCGTTLSMRRLMSRVERAARGEIAVLIIGESGTGKELIARALHELSPRAAQPLVTVDCGSLAPTLVASELFGHERGAFTGADKQHLGAFERAHRGTLFLDEVGELPDALQASLLGALERGRFRRLGGRADIDVDVRVVSATNRDLRAAVNSGAFRLDLYYRLAALTLAVPPLRDRLDDLPLLAEHFARDLGWNGALDRLISAETLQRLIAHRWPGNVRELRNYVEATLAMGEAPPMDDSVQPAGRERPEGQIPDWDASYREARNAALLRFEQTYLQRLMERVGGNVSRGAREAQMDRTHLSDLLKRHRLR